MKTWKLECALCEPYLSTDPLFSTSLADLPETPDEVKGSEDFAKRGATDRDNVLAIAMAKLAGVELPQTIRQAISGASPALPAIAGIMVCEQGHDCEPGSRFCTECGSPMRRPSVAACPNGHQVGREREVLPRVRHRAEPGRHGHAAAIEPPAAVPAAAAKAAPRVKPLKDWRVEDLRALARRKGLDDSGTRVEVLERIRQAKVPVAAVMLRVRAGDRVQVRRECDEGLSLTALRTPPGTVTAVRGSGAGAELVVLDSGETIAYRPGELELLPVPSAGEGG